VADQVRPKEMAERRRKGQRWWFYNGMRPMSGAVPLDAQAVDFRVQPWICRLYGVELWFYWEGTHWRHNHQGPRANLDQNVFEDPITFTTGPDMEVNGDGTLFYPGEDAIFPEEDRGIQGPISSIRMKNLRRGQQDVAYIALATRAGREKEALAIARALIPRAFDLAKPDEEVSWPLDGSAWDRARRALAKLFIPAH
jgi:type IV secretory pathway TrbD component